MKPVTEAEATEAPAARQHLLPRQDPAGQGSKQGSYLNEIIFSLINVIVGVPTMVSYAAVVFKARC